MEKVANNKETHPPPMYFREKSSNTLISTLKSPVGNNFNVVTLKRAVIDKTKIQIYDILNYNKINKNMFRRQDKIK